MPTLDPLSLRDQLNWRYAVKKFDPTKKIPAATWQVLEDALVLTPSSFGLQPWKFFVVDNESVRQQLKPVSWNQSQITDASHLVVCAQKKNLGTNDVLRFIQKTADIRHIPQTTLSGYQQMMIGFVNQPSGMFDVNQWTARQVYIAIGNLLTSAAVLGIDACPMEGFDAAQYDTILKVGPDYHCLCVVTLGYRAADDAYASLAKVRFDKKDLIEHI